MDLFELNGRVVVNLTDAVKAFNEIQKEGQKTQGKLSKFFSGIGKGAIAVGKTVGTGMIAAGTAVAGLVGMSTQAYAQYEQLVGGVETLFGAGGKSIEEYAASVGKSVEDVRAEYSKLMVAEQDVLNNAKNAFKTAGLSANEYMETVTSFAASLLQSLDGDTVKAAEKADMAISDMSDNANKMGTSMEMIQNAYQGFAKQNYTMLDNLKLGYGGTKEEMARLLADAQAISGIKYDISSYADIVDAIHVIQDEMGITGTTALEAAETISGSTASMKAAWENLMTAMADDNADVGAYISTFVDSAATALQNYMPRIGIALQGVVQLVEQLAPVIIAKIPELVGQLLPSIIQAATGLITSLVQMFPQLLNTLTTQVLPQLLTGFTTIFGTLFTSIADFITVNLPIVTDKAKDMVGGLGDKIRENLPTLISTGLDILMGLSQTLVDNIPTLVAVGMDLLKSIVLGIVDALPELIAKAPEIITNFANTISNSFQTIFMKGGEIIWEIIKGIVNAIPDLIDNFPAVIEAIFSVWNAINWTNLGKNLMNGIKNGLKNAWGSLKSTASNLFGNLKQTITNPLQSAKTMIKGVIDAIKGFFNFKISWPKVPMPRFSVSPSGWKIGDLLKGSIPKLSIDWYAKAMDNPIVMTKPTIFGYNGATGELMGGGEAGTEVVSGANTLMNMIQTAVAAQNDALASRMDTLIDMLSEYFPEALDAMRTPATFDPVRESRTLAPYMNQELGKIATLKGRGR